MRILVLTKRQYMGRDLLLEWYGRFRELPLALSKNGHKVEGLILSYRPSKEGTFFDCHGYRAVRWSSVNLNRLFSVSKRSYWRAVEKIKTQFCPDLVWACSDAPHAVLGREVAIRLKARLVIDLYDNFESYALTGFPGMRAALRRAIAAADGVTCVSRQLADLVRRRYGYKGPITVLENGVPGNFFNPMNKMAARQILGLPISGFMIGTVGAISKSRGISVLFNAFETLAKERSNLRLILAGPRDSGLVLPTGDRVHDLGSLPPHRVPHVLSALDVSVICNRESAFGAYCFPQKFYESVACGVPLAVAATGAMRDLLSGHPAQLFQPDNAESLVSNLRRHFERRLVLQWKAPSWRELGDRLGHFLEKVNSHYGILV